MHDPTTTTPMAPATADDPHGIRKELDKPGELFIVFVAVAGLALLNIYLSGEIGPTRYTLAMQLGIGSVQAWLVAYHFMHLKHSDKVVILTALSSLFWMAILFVLVLADYFTRPLLVG